MKISATIITYNEESNIGRCIKSLLPVVDEVILVDSFSTDNTVEMAKELGAKIFQRKFTGYTDQKNYSVEVAAFDHILSLDADEVLSEELQQSVLEVKKNWQHDGYYVNRLTNYCGKWIRHCGWQPEWKLRLWDRRKGKWKGELIHESVDIPKGKTARLQGDLLHYSYTTISSHIMQIEKFTTITSYEAFKKGKKVTSFHLTIYPLFFFVKKYFLQNGFRDGYYGFILCAISAFGKMLKYVKLNEFYKKDLSNPLHNEGFTS